LTAGAYEGTILPIWKYLKGEILVPGIEERVRACYGEWTHP
jgi:hypothetical protein